MAGEFLTPAGLRARAPEETLTLLLPRLQEFDIVRGGDIFETLHSTEALIDIRGLAGVPGELSRRFLMRFAGFGARLS